MNDIEKIPGFGQSDPTDNRSLLQWESRYPPEAKKHFMFEAVYLGSILAFIPFLMFVLLCHFPGTVWQHLDAHFIHVITKYGLAWAGGMLGGTLFAIKWLYHVVARELWNLDRRLWRLFTPHISGGLAFAVIVLISSGLTRIFDAQSTNSHAVVVGVSFLSGYFSDSAIAKLTDIADTLFGTTRSKEKHGPKLTASGKVSVGNGVETSPSTESSEAGSQT